jgi:rSAM/selenodomain-associated transferase 2
MHDDLMTQRIAVIIPTLNEAEGIRSLLESLQSWRWQGLEVIVVDGGSGDGTPDLSAGLADHILVAPLGRANQMNAGARIAKADILWFLHADTRLPTGSMFELLCGLRGAGKVWGRFDVEITGRHWMLNVVAFCMNLRSRWTGIATGDQAIFVYREAFSSVGCFPAQPLMEDIELSTRLHQLSRPLCLRSRVTTSGRRWERHGVWRTIGLMWWLRWQYWRGVSAETLAKHYREAE